MKNLHSLMNYQRDSSNGLEEALGDNSNGGKVKGTRTGHNLEAGELARPGSRGRSSPTPSRRSYPFKADPWRCNSGDFQMPGVNGGAWAPPPSAGSPSLGACESSTSPKWRVGSPVQKIKILANRDKESLMEEIIDLKKALLDQSVSLQRQKVHATNVELQNRRLEKDLEEVEFHGSTRSSRTGSALCLRAKLQGLKTRVADLQATCDGQENELFALRRDIRATRTKEIEVERDMFAEEIERLQKVIKHLKVLQNRLFCENKQLYRLKDRSLQLEAANQCLETCITDIQEALLKSNKEVVEHRQQANESMLRAKKKGKKIQELQEHSSLLARLLEKERADNRNLEIKISTLQDEVLDLERQLQNQTRAEQVVREEHEQGTLSRTWGFVYANPKVNESAGKANYNNKIPTEAVFSISNKTRPKSPIKGKLTKHHRNQQVKEHNKEAREMQAFQSTDMLRTTDTATHVTGGSLTIETDGLCERNLIKQRIQEKDQPTDTAELGESNAGGVLKVPVIPKLNLEQVSCKVHVNLSDQRGNIFETDSSSHSKEAPEEVRELAKDNCNSCGKTVSATKSERENEEISEGCKEHEGNVERDLGLEVDVIEYIPMPLSCERVGSGDAREPSQTVGAKVLPMESVSHVLLEPPNVPTEKNKENHAVTLTGQQRSVSRNIVAIRTHESVAQSVKRTSSGNSVKFIEQVREAAGGETKNVAETGAAAVENTGGSNLDTSGYCIY